MKRRRRKKTRIGKTGCLFWLLILLIIIVIFLYKGKGSFKDTIAYFKNFINKGKKVETIKKVEEKTLEKKSERLQPASTSNKSEKIEAPTETTKKKVTTTTQKTKKSEERAKKAATEIKSKTITKSIYFIKIELDGSAKPYPVKRKVEYKDSPIIMTINTLLKGPSASERKKGIISFIPMGTKLLSATINKKGHLILNFNGTLEENYSGRDAIILELSQILYTCFEFNSVKSVSILINGKRKQYLTGEGIPLKSSYSRSDLSKIWG